MFRGKLPVVVDITKAVSGAIELWRLAGAKCLESPFRELP